MLLMISYPYKIFNIICCLIYRKFRIGEKYQSDNPDFKTTIFKYDKSIINNMAKKEILLNRKLVKSIKEAQKDPNFIKEINKFIKATTNISKLN